MHLWYILFQLKIQFEIGVDKRATVTTGQNVYVVWTWTVLLCDTSDWLYWRWRCYVIVLNNAIGK